MNAVQRVKDICKKRNIPIYKLEKDCGFSNGYIGQLRKGTMPDDRLRIVAAYLEVSPEELSTGEKPEIPSYDKDTMEMIKLFSKLNKEQKNSILVMMRSFALDD